MHSTQIRKAHGFTLIELLVVIAIIAILAAILFPVFAQAKEAAKKTADLSNMKQLGLALQMYANDFDDVYPTIRNGPSNWGCPGWTGKLGDCHQDNRGHAVMDPYVKNRQIWKAPNDSLQRCDDVNQCTDDFTGGPVSYIFTFNGQQNIIRDDVGDVANGTAFPYGFGIFGHAWASTNGTPNNRTTGSFSTTAVGAPAQTVAMVPSYVSWTYWSGLMQYRNDQRQYAFTELGMPSWPQFQPIPFAWCCASDGFAFGAYSGKSNFSFADSHAKSMDRTALMDRLWLTDPATAKANHAKNLIHYDASYK